jgi:hypothetical protein
MAKLTEQLAQIQETVQKPYHDESDEEYSELYESQYLEETEFLAEKETDKMYENNLDDFPPTKSSQSADLLNIITTKIGADIDKLQNDVKNLKADLKTVKSDVKELKITSKYFRFS